MGQLLIVALFMATLFTLLWLSAGAEFSDRFFIVSMTMVIVYGLSLLFNRPQHLVLDSTSNPTSNPDSLSILSYNMFMRPGFWLIKSNASDYKEERFAAFLTRMACFDIMALQEMFGLLTFRQRKLLRVAAERGFCHAAVTGAAPYVFWDRTGSARIPFLDAGVVTLSRFPIVATDSHYYTKSSQIDGWAPKQVLWALVQLPNPGSFVHVFNTHMQSSYSHAPSEASLMARAAQVVELAAFVKDKVYGSGDARHSAIICGDFNLDARSVEYVRMMDVLRRELVSEECGFVVRDLMLDAQGMHPITYGDPRERVLTHTSDLGCQLSLDYVIYVGPIQGGALRHVTTQLDLFECEPNEAGPCTHLSDHMGVTSEFDLN